MFTIYNPEVRQATRQELLEHLTMIREHKIPKSLKSPVLDSCLQVPYMGTIKTIREIYIRECGFPYITESWVKPLARWIGNRKCLEVMAGTGWLSYALSKYKVAIKATDNYSWEHKFADINKNVERIDAIEAVEKYGKQVKFIIMAWPYMDNTAYRVLMKMREVNPDCRIIYIGEWFGGCTADDEFFEAIIEECDLKGFNKVASKYRSWEGIHDTLCLLR